MKSESNVSTVKDHCNEVTPLSEECDNVIMDLDLHVVIKVFALCFIAGFCCPNGWCSWYNPKVYNISQMLS